ncbi:MAG: response regulator [Acidobacteriota bacterium]|nr:response regulator [Acidobacteriota bacterium]MDQ3418183.1 response regulator [Acidobacteriota bacterium]
MKTVLVVEDDPDMRDLERAVLEFGGYSVTLARNGVEALRHLEQTLPDVIILDLMMPVMDGLTFLAERSRRGLAASIPVLCVSAAGREMTAHALRLGANECISKPTDMDTLCERVLHYSTRRH